MKARSLLIFVIFLALTAVFAGYFLIRSLRPGAAAIKAAQADIKPVPEVVRNGTFDQAVKDLQKNGPVPVKVDDSELGKENPFAGP